MTATIRDMISFARRGGRAAWHAGQFLMHVWVWAFAFFVCLLITHAFFFWASPLQLYAALQIHSSRRRTLHFIGWTLQSTSHMWLVLLARALSCGGELPGFPIRKMSGALATSFMARRQDDMFPWPAVSTKICNCTGGITVDNDVFRFDSLEIQTGGPGSPSLYGRNELGSCVIITNISFQI